MEREELYSQILGELIEQGYREYREANEEVGEKHHRLSDISGILDTVKEKLTADEYAQFSEYRELVQETTEQEIRESYVNGAKDCVALLKKLGVF